MKQGCSPLSRSELYFIYVSKLTGKWGRVLTPLVGWVPGMNAEAPDVPFVQGNFLTHVCFIGFALAIALGFRQSAWEPSQGTALYLLHLPLPRRTHLLDEAGDGDRSCCWRARCCRS